MPARYTLPTDRDSDKLFSDSVKIAVKELAPGSEYSVLVFERERRSRTESPAEG